MHIVDKYRELGSYRAAGQACGVDHKTVKRVVERAERGEVDPPRRPRLRAHNYDAVAGLVARRVEETRGRISAKRLLAAASAEGYEGRPATSGGWWPGRGRSGAVRDGCSGRGGRGRGSSW
jgi:hypothetical protein